MLRFPDPEYSALQLLTRTQQNTPPVDLATIASLWDWLTIEFTEIKHDGYLIDLGGFGKQIIVSSFSSLPRQRFTIAHEMGHLTLQENEAIFDTSGSLRVEEPTQNKLIERWCDQFAVALLMPREWIVGDLRRAKITGLIDAIVDLPRVYGVSDIAFRKRVAETTPISTYEIARTTLLEKHIETKYEAKGVKRYSVRKVLDNLLPKLEASPEPVKVVHKKSNMISVHMSTVNQPNRSVWIICIFPQLSNG